MSIIFLHPDLGIGGAERAIIDAAVLAKRSGYNVEIITNFHDPQHAFEETINGTLKITPIFQRIPRTLMGRFVAFCAMLKMMLAALWIAFFRRGADVVFVDQVSAPLLILRIFRFKTVFFIHFPDTLLASHSNWLKKIYRLPLDAFEEWTTGLAKTLVVNSLFTGETTKSTFQTLTNREIDLLYPVPNTDNLVIPSDLYPDVCGAHYIPPDADKAKLKLSDLLPVCPKIIFVSINRYERKKNIKLAIESLSFLIDNWDLLVVNDRIEKDEVMLIHAGGYDNRITENVEHFKELQAAAMKHNVSSHVMLLRSISSHVKSLLLAASSAVIYTPSNEHFGIVPLEAMYLGRPVIALDSGGPRETVVNDQTGFLCTSSYTNSETAQHIAGVMSKFINDTDLTIKMAGNCHEHFLANFSSEVFRRRLVDILEKTASVEENKRD